MEVSVQDYTGLPEGCLLSVRAGSTRRQAPVPLCEPLRFPSLPFNARQFKVDVMKTLGSAKLDINAQQALESYVVAMDLGSGQQANIRLAVREEPSLCGKRSTELKQHDQLLRKSSDGNGLTSLSSTGVVSMPASPSAPVAKTSGPSPWVLEAASQAAKDTRDYARQHNIPAVVQEILQHVLRERPAAPFSVMASRLRKAQGEGEQEPAVAAASEEIAALKAQREELLAQQKNLQAELAQARSQASSARAPPAVGMPGPFHQKNTLHPTSLHPSAAMPMVQDQGPDLERMRLEAEHLALRVEHELLQQELASLG